MRKILCIIGLLLSCCFSVKADEILTATLQHKGQMTPFFGDSAFYYANRSAQDGDTITLSRGVFRADTIWKSIRLVGTGGVYENSARTKIGVTDFNSSKCIVIHADNVQIEGMYLGTFYISEVENCVIKRCGCDWSRSNYRTGKHKNTVIDQCYIETEYSWDKGENYTIKNSTIHRLYDKSTVGNLITLTNCFVEEFYRNGEVLFYTYKPHGIFTNCILGLDADTQSAPEYQITGLPEYQFKAPSEFYYNYIFRFNSRNDSNYYVPYSFAPDCINEHNEVNSENSSAVWCYEDHPYSYTPSCYTPWETGSNWVPPMTGSDGTPVGLTGGSGFSTTPGIPTISVSSATPSDTSGLLKRNFYLYANPENKGDDPYVVQFEYWVDDPYGEKQTIPVNERPSTTTYVRIQQLFDFSALKPGTHTLYYRSKDNYGAYSPLYVQSFERRNPYDEVLLLPYDATSLDEVQQTANPTYMAYPTEIESQMPTIQCNDSN